MLIWPHVARLPGIEKVSGHDFMVLLVADLNLDARCLLTASTQKILEEALSLPKEDREGLIEALAQSLDLSPVELSPEWKHEIADRIAQIERGDVKTVPWREVQARVDASLKVNDHGIAASGRSGTTRPAKPIWRTGLR